MSAAQRNAQKVSLSGIPAERQGTCQAMNLEVGDLPIMTEEDCGGGRLGSPEEPRSGHPMHPLCSLALPLLGPSSL